MLTTAPAVLQDLSDEQGAGVVKEAFKQGINFFDTSPYYGVTRSETVRLQTTSAAQPVHPSLCTLPWAPGLSGLSGVWTCALTGVSEMTFIVM